MEWDLCPGNIIDDEGHVWLFDFGYMYPFNPLCEFNSNGLSDPLFHACERFETRNFFGWLLRQGDALSPDAALELYHDLKTVALSVYRQKLAWLEQQGAEPTVLIWVSGLITQWQQALQSRDALQSLMEVENFRSQVLDIEDDLHGQSCTALTLKRLELVERCIRECFPALKQGGVLFYDNAGKSQSELLGLYRNNFV